ncbi:MAG: hypothetical protein JWN75_282 [Candidatus Saccharibacteria bacterium]|nr:hypothetical protein [Candidatus Saccharibacteria bacterium]
MSQKIHILYISGLGDKYDRLRLRCLRLWKFKDVTVELIPMNWEMGTFEQKLARIDTAINRVSGKKVVLIGESAGGSMAVHTYARRGDALYKVTTLCGKNSQPEKVSESYYVNHPSFRESMNQLNASIDKLSDDEKERFVSIHPLYDPTVPVRETLIPGCRRVRIWTAGHFLTIMLAITILSPIVIHAVRRK